MSTIATEHTLTEHLLYLLNGDGAHADFAAVVDNLPAALQGKRPQGAQYSPWELLEHMRITQRDVLDSILEASHTSPEFPAGYWPSASAPANEAAWAKSVKEFQTDFKEIVELITSRSGELLSPLPHASDQTIMRRLMMLADHTSYHLGQLVLGRKLLGAWPE
jgi:DinB family protein